MKLILSFFLALSCYSLTSQIVWEPLAPLNLEDVEIIHVSEDRMLATVNLPPRLLVSEDLGSTWIVISDIPQLESTPLVDVDRDGNYLVLFDEVIYKLEPEGYVWAPFFDLPEAPVVWNDIAAFSNGNILIRERKGLRLHDSEGNFIKEKSFGNVVTKNFIKGEGDEHYFFLSPGNVYGYIVKINSNMEILEEYPEDDFYIHSHYAYDGSRFYSTTGYSDDGRNWTKYSGDMKGNITILNNGDIHMIAGCSGGVTLPDDDCTRIYVSSDQGESFDYQGDIDFVMRLPNPGSADLRRTTLMGTQGIGEEGVILFNEKKNYYSENGIDSWTRLGVDYGLPSMDKVEAASKESVFAGVSYWYDNYMISESEGWLDLSAFICGDRPRIVSLSNGTLIGSQNCISENQGADWTSAVADVTYWNIFVKDDVVYAHDRDETFTSSDFGKNWAVGPIPEKFTTIEYFVLDFSSTEFIYLWNFETEGVFKYNLAGDSISLINFENDRILYFKTAYVGPHVYELTNNTFYVSEDDAVNFVETNLPPIAISDIKGLYVDHENTLYIYSEKEIWISYDHGTIWQDISPIFQDLLKINYLDVSWDGHIFAATDGTPILRSNKVDIVQAVDVDSDGFVSTEDCDDNNPNVNPDQIEEPYNGIDDDCDPDTFDDDLDQDGFLLVDDCDDMNADINPDGVEIANNQIDEDCDGLDLLTTVFELSSSTVNIYPNPAIDYIKIDVNGQLDFQINLYGLEGKLMHTANNSSQINTESFSAGTYLLEIKDVNSGQRIVERIVIAK